MALFFLQMKAIPFSVRVEESRKIIQLQMDLTYNKLKILELDTFAFQRDLSKQATFVTLNI